MKHNYREGHINADKGYTGRHHKSILPNTLRILKRMVPSSIFVPCTLKSPKPIPGLDFFVAWLEPETATIEEAANSEYLNMRRRFWIAVILTLPVVVLEMVGHGFRHFISASSSNRVQLLLATPTVSWCGWSFFQRVW